jgi:hypothetical protein
MFSSNNDEWNRFPYGKQFFHLVTKISCPIRVNEGWVGVHFFFWSFLKVRSMETERNAIPSRVKQLVPRCLGGMAGRKGPPLSPLLSPQALLGSIPWHLGIWNLFI